MCSFDASLMLALTSMWRHCNDARIAFSLQFQSPPPLAPSGCIHYAQVCQRHQRPSSARVAPQMSYGTVRSFFFLHQAVPLPGEILSIYSLHPQQSRRQGNAADMWSSRAAERPGRTTETSHEIDTKVVAPDAATEAEAHWRCEENAWSRAEHCQRSTSPLTNENVRLDNGLLVHTSLAGANGVSAGSSLANTSLT